MVLGEAMGWSAGAQSSEVKPQLDPRPYRFTALIALEPLHLSFLSPLCALFIPLFIRLFFRIKRKKYSDFIKRIVFDRASDDVGESRLKTCAELQKDSPVDSVRSS